MEGQLTVLQHSNELLVADRKREEELLEGERRGLERLERRVREEGSFNKGEARKTEHRLLKKPVDSKHDLSGITLASRARVDLSDVSIYCIFHCISW